MEFSLVFRRKDDSHSLYEKTRTGDIIITTEGCGEFDDQNRWVNIRDSCPRWHGTTTYNPEELTTNSKSTDAKHVKIYPCAIDAMISRIDDQMKSPIENVAQTIAADPLRVDVPLDTNVGGAETWIRYATFKMGYKHFRCYAPVLYANCTGGVHAPATVYNAISLRYMGLFNYDTTQPTVIARQSVNGALIYGEGKGKLLDSFNFSNQIESAKTVKQNLTQFCTDAQWQSFNSTNVCPVVASFHRIMRSYTAAVAATMLSSLSLTRLRQLRPKAQLGRSPMDYLKYVKKLDVKPIGIANKSFTWQIVACVRSVFACPPMGAEEEEILERLYNGGTLSVEDQVTLFPPAAVLREIHDTRRRYTVDDVRTYFQLQTLLSSIPGLNFYPAYVVGTTNMSDTVSLETWAVSKKSRSLPGQWSGTICNANNLDTFAKNLDTRESPFKVIAPLTIATDYRQTPSERNMMTTVIGSMCSGICEAATFVIPVKLPRKSVILICVAPKFLAFHSCELALRERFPRLFSYAYARVIIRMDITKDVQPLSLDYEITGPIKGRVVHDDVGCGTYLILQSGECVLECGEFFLKLSERSARH
ncbi:outer capsid protein [Chobar Gorge virus]|uniref:Outer capsid protein n=1 Tax=Chobar Gorge virus TaxID=1679172 RepID=A0A0H4M6S9_9REOV|nr:outer capsid protein [Chobar Gorge virus]AKP24100.1 outer capsid protein [Chobar Gorge virus]